MGHRSPADAEEFTGILTERKMAKAQTLASDTGRTHACHQQGTVETSDRESCISCHKLQRLRA
eukprot:3960783-Lingulodinium_polyedra.AAC.1